MRKADLYAKPVNTIRYNKHRRRKNNDVVAAMYAMYQSPKSLREVAEAYRKSEPTVYSVFRSRNYALRKKKLRGLQVYDGIKFTLRTDGYIGATIEKKTVLMHTYVWKKIHGPVPDGYGVTHIDKNKENNVPENLALKKLPNKLTKLQ